MAKKKAAKGKTKRAGKVRKGLKRKSAARPPARAKKKAARKPAKKSARRKAVKKSVKKAAKKAVKRAVKKGVKKLARPARKRPMQTAPVKPKRPRRVKQALPPKVRVTRAPVVEAEPVLPPPPPAPLAPWPPLEAEVIEPPPPPMPKIGEVAPDFDLPDETGRKHSLAQYRGQKVVLYFYPKDDTPGCTTEACGIRDSLGQFTDRNAVVLGVSADSVDSHQRFAQKYSLTFPLLADEGHRVAEQYGVWVEKERFGEKKMGIARTTFLIDQDGRIAHVFRDVRPDGHDQEILRYL